MCLKVISVAAVAIGESTNTDSLGMRACRVRSASRYSMSWVRPTAKAGMMTLPPFLSRVSLIAPTSSSWVASMLL